MGYEIESTVPLPPAQNKSSEIVATLKAMGEGDSVVVPARAGNIWRAVAKKEGVSITTRKIADTDDIRIWRTA